MSKFKGAKPNPSKFNPKSPEPPSTPQDPNQLPPVFSFEYMVEGNGYSVTCCDRDNQAAVTARMFLLRQVTWLQIRQAQRHGIGSEKIARTAIKPAIPARVTDDAELLALRYNGLRPMIGFRDGRVFNILFIDHTMDCYPHE
jgi:hypothetical protein